MLQAQDGCWLNNKKGYMSMRQFPDPSEKQKREMEMHKIMYDAGRDDAMKGRFARMPYGISYMQGRKSVPGERPWDFKTT